MITHIVLPADVALKKDISEYKNVVETWKHVPNATGLRID